ISLSVSNVTAYTCSNCTAVAYNGMAYDNCCSNVTLVYNPPVGTCFAVNSNTPVTVTAYDDCGNSSASEALFVSVLPAANCARNQCISLSVSNVVAYSCTNCTTVAYNGWAADNCCSNVTLVYNPPEGTCFPPNSTTLVTVTAYDDCGNSS